MVDGNFCCYPHTVKGLFVTLGFVSSGGVTLRWFRDNFAQTEVAQAEANGQDVYDLLLDSMPEEPSPVMLLPHFTGSGTPTLDLNAKGAILGLTLSTTKSDLIKAVLEGISFEIKHNLNLLASAGVEINEIRAIGGGAKSEKWLQLKADIFGKNVVALDVSEGVCMGAAILAGTAIGKYNSVREAAQTLIHPKKVYLPDPQQHQRYLERMETYTRIYDAIKPVTP
jgi:xylulokinase